MKERPPLKRKPRFANTSQLDIARCPFCHGHLIARCPFCHGHLIARQGRTGPYWHCSCPPWAI